MRVNKVKTRRGKKFLEDRAPKLVENDKMTFIARGGKCSETLNKILQELYMLKKPLVTRLQRKNPIHPFEDDSLLCKFSHKLDSSLFVFGSSTKKHPSALVFGRMYDHQMLDMVELRADKFVPTEEFKVGGVTLGVKPCIILQGPLFESDETLQRLGNLMVDWFRGTKTDHVRLQGLELIISLTALSEDRVLFRVYKTILKKSTDSVTPRVELLEIGPSIDFRVDRKKLASESLYRTALKKPKIVQKPANKNVKFDEFGNKVAKVHTGRQQTDAIQTRKVKALKRSSNVKRFDEGEEAMEEG